MAVILFVLIVVSIMLIIACCYIHRLQIKLETSEKNIKDLEYYYSTRYGKRKGENEKATQDDFDTFFSSESVLNDKEEAARLNRVYKNTFNNHKYDYWETYRCIYESYEDTVARINMISREFKKVFGEDTITAERFIAPLGLMKAAITQDIVKVGNSIVGRVPLELKEIRDRVEACNDAVVNLMQKFIALSLVDEDKNHFIAEVERLTKELEYYRSE